MKKNPYVEAKNSKELCDVLGLPRSHAAKLEIRRELVIAIRDRIKEKRWTHLQASKYAEVGRTVITAIMNGDIGKISTDRLIDIADRLGLTVEINVA